LCIGENHGTVLKLNFDYRMEAIYWNKYELQLNYKIQVYTKLHENVLIKLS